MSRFVAAPDDIVFPSGKAFPTGPSSTPAHDAFAERRKDGETWERKDGSKWTKQGGRIVRVRAEGGAAKAGPDAPPASRTGDRGPPKAKPAKVTPEQALAGFHAVLARGEASEQNVKDAAEALAGLSIADVRKIAAERGSKVKDKSKDGLARKLAAEALAAAGVKAPPELTGEAIPAWDTGGVETPKGPPPAATPAPAPKPPAPARTPRTPAHGHLAKLRAASPEALAAVGLTAADLDELQSHLDAPAARPLKRFRAPPVKRGTSAAIASGSSGSDAEAEKAAGPSADDIERAKRLHRINTLV